MINLKEIIINPSILDNSLTKRNLPSMANTLIQLSTEVKDLIKQTQEIQHKRNVLAKEIGALKQQNKDITMLKLQVNESKEQEVKLLEDLKNKQDCLNEKLLYIPNILHSSVPKGKNEEENQLVRTHLLPKNFSFTPKPHYEIGENLGFMDFKRAVKLSGTRFNIMSNMLSKLERALVNFMLDTHTKEHGFIEYSVPVIVNEEALIGTSQLPKFAEDMFKTNQANKWLISTGEISLTNLFREEFLNIKDLPIRVTASTLCFRKEAGSRGKDTKGILRQHQFTKVELVSFVHPKNSLDELEYLTSAAENVLKKLKIPYRVMLLCGGDTGFASSKTYDIEVWLPSEQKYREISSCSLCTDFQARRMQTKVKDNKENIYIHTLNGSGLAIGRTLIAILENYQQEDGSIIIPEALVPYMNGLKVIKKEK